MKGFKRLFFLSMLLVLVVSLFSGVTFAQDKNVLDTLKGENTASIFLEAVEMANLTDILTEGEGVTVLVPTDDVADDLKAAMDEGDTDKIYSIVSCHIISSEILTASDLSSAGEVYTDGGMITVKQEDNDIIINDTIKIVKADIKAKNGIIHLIDGVILPQEEEVEEIFEEEPVEEEAGD
ncbi:MAG TPA: fasciclin domain-containing protein [bacterium]|nr:fasciclin domain-containing protein [bacterium]HOP55942.1 fasciclin domain-containing protein [bacterium]